MINKHYSIFCSICTKTEMLFSGTVRECEKEAKINNWSIINGEWICEECKAEKMGVKK